MIGKDELIQRSIESGGYGLVVHEAKLYYTARKEAREAGQVIDLTQGPEPVTTEDESITDAERRRIGDKFIAEHKDRDDEVGLSSPPRGDPFSADFDTQPGDAEATYERLMTEEFGERPDRTSKRSKGRPSAAATARYKGWDVLDLQDECDRRDLRKSGALEALAKRLEADGWRPTDKRPSADPWDGANG